MNKSHPDTHADNLESYRIHSVREVLSFLDELRQQRQLMRMIFSQGKESVLTSILDIDAGGKAMYIDATPDPAQNRRIMLTQQVSFETTLDRIRILFTASDAQHCDHDGFPTLRFPIPASLVRMQRRQAYRVSAPFTSPIHCIFMPPGTDRRVLEAPMPVNLLNISTGGIAVIDPGYLLDSRPGAVYSACQLAFPGYPVTVALEVRHAQVITLPSGKAARHIGLRFVEAPNQVIALVQRYILKLEREQNAPTIGAMK